MKNKKKKKVTPRNTALAAHVSSTGNRGSGIHEDAERKYRKQKEAHIDDGN